MSISNKDRPSVISRNKKKLSRKNGNGLCVQFWAWWSVQRGRILIKKKRRDRFFLSNKFVFFWIANLRFFLLLTKWVQSILWKCRTRKSIIPCLSNIGIMNNISFLAFFLPEVKTIPLHIYLRIIRKGKSSRRRKIAFFFCCNV